MSCKSRALYVKIVMKIKTILQLNVSDIITDFEEALFQSFSSAFPEADGSGCLFHYKKATYQTGILKNGLANLYSCDEQFRCWVQLLMNLPLLPSEKIVETYHLVKDSKPELFPSDIEKVDKFLRYYERYWLRQVGSSRLSVFNKEKRTTNDLESFHANLKRKFKSHTPNFWEFIQKLNAVIVSTAKDMERIDGGLSIQRNCSRPKTIQRNRIIEVFQGQSLNGKITCLDFLKRVGLSFRTLEYSNVEIEANELEVARETDDESTNEDTNISNARVCKICLGVNADTIILPCRHTQTCFSCTDKIITQDDQKHCPICRGVVEQYKFFFEV